MKNIAIIGDDIHIGDMLQEVLHREGCGILRAYFGTEALRLHLIRKNAVSRFVHIAYAKITRIRDIQQR